MQKSKLIFCIISFFREVKCVYESFLRIGKLMEWRVKNRNEYQKKSTEMALSASNVNFNFLLF